MTQASGILSKNEGIEDGLKRILSTFLPLNLPPKK
jgi:hypothetical protein